RQCANLRRKRREDLPGDDALFDAGSSAGTAFPRRRRREREQVLELALRVLDPARQDVFWMRHVEGFSREEIAERLALGHVAEVRTVLQTARRQLERELERILVELGHGRSLLR